jgi:hypothetical protein
MLRASCKSVYKTNHLFYFVFCVSFKADLFVSVVSILIRNTETNRNKPKNEKQPKQVEFRFVSVRTENLFCLFRGHPSYDDVRNQIRIRLRVWICIRLRILIWLQIRVCLQTRGHKSGYIKNPDLFTNLIGHYSGFVSGYGSGTGLLRPKLMTNGLSSHMILVTLSL